MSNKKNPSILEANIFFFIIVILFIFVGSYVQGVDFNAGILITEFILIFVPVLFYLSFKGYNVNKVLRLNKISFLQGIITPFIVLFAYPVAMFVNLIGVMILAYFGKVIPNPIPMAQSTNDFIIGIFVISFSAGICEEILFRGMLLSSYERLGKVKSIVITGILFGIMHLNVQNLIGPIFLGILFGYIVYKTNSIFIAIIAHSANNFIAWSISFLATKVLSIIPENPNTDILNNLSGIKAIIAFTPSLIAVGIFAIFGGGLAFLLIYLLPKTKEVEVEDNKIEEPSTVSILSYIPVVIVLFVYVFFTYRILATI